MPDKANAGAGMTATGRGTRGRVQNEIGEIPHWENVAAGATIWPASGRPDGSDKPSSGKSAIPNTGGYEE